MTRKLALVWALLLTTLLPTARAASPEDLALDYFTREQSADGSWTALARPSSVLYSTHAIFLYEYLGRLEEKRPIVNELLKFMWTQQNRDGGFPGYPGGPSDHAITVLAYLANRIAGESETSLRMIAIERFLVGPHGRGFEGDRRAFLYLPYLWLFGVDRDASCLMGVTEPLMLAAESRLPWLRAVLYPMIHLYVSGGIHELPRDKFPSRLSYLRGHCPTFVTKLPHPFRARNRHKKFWAWMESHVNEDGTFFDYAPTTIPALMAFSTGGAKYAPLVEKGLKRIEEFQIRFGDGERMQSPGESSVGETNHALAALLNMGIGADDPRVAAGERFLYSVQQPTTGAWGFSKHNLHFPDSDDTSSAIYALKRVSLLRGAGKTAPDLEQRMEKGLDWLLTLQNKDGGFATWESDHLGAVSGPMKRFASRSGIVLTESIIEHTGRIAQTLELFRDAKPAYAQAYERALGFLVKVQAADGSYPGTWLNDYLIGTAMALGGLGSGLHVHPEAPALVRAADRALKYLLTQQRPDGSFSESPASFVAGHTVPLEVGSPAQTGLITGKLLGYLEATNGRSRAALWPAIERAVAYLENTQHPDGTWQDLAWTGVIFPKVEYVIYPYIQQVGAMESIGVYRRMKAE